MQIAMHIPDTGVFLDEKFKESTQKLINVYIDLKDKTTSEARFVFSDKLNKILQAANNSNITYNLSKPLNDHQLMVVNAIRKLNANDLDEDIVKKTIF